MAFVSKADQKLALDISDGNALSSYDLKQRECAANTNMRGELSFTLPKQNDKPWQAGLGKYAPGKSDK